MATTQVAQPSQKNTKKSSYACHICGLNGHKMIDCPKFIKMQKMFNGEFVIVKKVQPIAETQIVIADVNVVDVNVTRRNKSIQKQVFKDKKPKKVKSVVNQEKEEWLKQSMVETIQQIQKTQAQTKGPSTSMEGWNTTWLGMPSKRMLEINYTLNLRQ